MRSIGFRLFIVCLAGLAAVAIAAPARAQDFGPGVRPEDLTSDAILHDPDAPVVGNPNGDVTIVAFEDYNCPFCKKADPALLKLVKDDGHIRLVYKDWPILSDTSLYGAELALAAKYEGKYAIVHEALMHIPAVDQVPEKEAMDKAVADAGVDIAHLKQVMGEHIVEIGAILQRNNAQALGMGFRGTPVFLIGPYFVLATLDYKGFKRVVAEVRAKKTQ
jgi:protein-disulfide isomerase